MRWSVFTKPWAGLPGDELGRLVAGLGFAGAEIPVRDTARLTPATAEHALPTFAKQLRAEGVEPISVASELTEQVFTGCAEARVPMIRIMAELGPDGYAASVQRVRVKLEEVVPLTERYGVTVGIQPHHGRFVSSTLGVLQLLDGLPAAYQLVWDAGHDALAGDDPAVTLPLAGDRLGLVNLKNATYVRTADGWRSWFVQGSEGLSDWATIFRNLGDYDGPICFTGQYSDLSIPVEEQLEADLALAQGLVSLP